MQRLLRLAVLLPALALLPILDVVAQNAKKPAAKPADPADKTAFDETRVRNTVLTGAYVQGKLTITDADKKEFTVTYTHQVKTPNAEGTKKLAALRQQYQQAVQQKNKKRADELSAEAAGISQYNVEEFPIAFDCVGDDKLIVRTLVKPMDENGKVKKLTAAEEKKLKGDDPKLLGYTATIKDLEDGMLVRIYIDKAKLKDAKPGAKDTKSDKDAKKDDKKDTKKDDKDTKDAEKTIYPITMIVIVPPPAEGAAAAAGGGGNNPFTKGK